MLNAHLPSADRLLARETVRFVITGVGAAAFFYGLTLLLLELGVPPFEATLAAYAIAFVVSYSVQHAWTFRGRQAHRRSLPRYLVAQGTAALFASTLAHLCGDGGAPAVLVAAASTLGGSALSFLLSKHWVFAQRAASDPARA